MNTKRHNLVVWGALFVMVFMTAFVFAVGGHASATAGINAEMSFEGKIVTAAGINVPDGSYNMEFKIYSGGTATGGGTLNWTEDWLGHNSQAVTFSSGTFQVNLGSICAFSGGSCQGNTNTGVNWNSNPLYLSLQIGNTSTVCTTFSACGGDGEMSPYILLTATPYAMNSNQLGGLTASQFGQLATGQTWTAANVFQPANDTPGLVVQQTAAASPANDIFDVEDTAGTADFIQVNSDGANAGNVTIQSIGSGEALTLQGGGSVTINTAGAATAGAITMQPGTSTGASSNGAALSISAGDASGTTSVTGGLLTLTAGNATGGSGTRNGGNVNIDAGAGATANGIVTIAPTNATTVLIGSATTSNTTQHLLQLNSVSTFSEAATCSTSTNQGALYYNTTSNSIRGCVNGNWEDLASTSGLGIILFGVVPDSSNAGAVGDLGGISGNTNSPCKVVIGASTTQIIVKPCIAYSGGRKVIVSSTTINTTSGNLAANAYANVCLTGANNQPALLGANTTESSAAVPTWNVNNPILCLATIKVTTTAGTVGNIYDIRTFTTTAKTFSTTNTAIGLGWVMIQSASANILTDTSSAGIGKIDGISVGYSGAVSSTAINLIIATAGPQWVKATSTSSVNTLGETSTTAGYSTETGTNIVTDWAALGTTTRTVDTTCTTNANCQFSQFFNPLLIR